jgi:hypothetical protein
MFLNQPDGVLFWPGAANAVQRTPLDNYSILSADTPFATTTLTTVWSFGAIANGIYEVDFLIRWQASVTTTGLKLGIIAPTGADIAMLAEVSGVKSGTTAPTFLELGVSGTGQNGPVAAAVSTPTIARGRGIIALSTTAGSAALQVATSVSGTTTIKAGSFLRWKRIA